MKKFFGLCILVVMLVAISGCTQQAQPAAPVTTLPTTEVPTTVAIAVPTTVPPTTVSTVVTTIVPTVVTTATPKSTSTPSTTVTTIYIRNNSFVPNELMVLPGTGITWINADSGIHIVKASGKSEGKFTSSEMLPIVGTFSYTFGETEGRYEYMDTVSNATGVIIIKKGESFYGNPTVSTTVTPTS
jgi:plastocyanin